MEYLKKLLKKTGWLSLVESVIFAIIGIVLIQNPEGSVKVISYILGISFIISGAYKIIAHLAEKQTGNLYDYSVVYGLMAIIIGIIMMVFSGAISTLFGVIVGIWIIYSAILRASSSIKLKEISDSKIWIVSIVLSVLMLICGIYIIANASKIAAAIGIFVLIYSIIDIVENIIFLKNVSES